MRRAVLLALLLSPGVALAHKPSDSYLRADVAEARVNVRWDIAVRDADFALGLDASGDGHVTWGEVKAARARLDAWALASLDVRGDGAACPLRAAPETAALRLADHTDGAYVVLELTADCPAVPAALALDYRLLFDRDPQHRGLLALSAGGAVSTAIFRPDARAQTFPLAHVGALQQLAAFVREGVWHVWIGIDHVLFLLALLLPAVLRREHGSWSPSPSLRAALVDVIKVVTAFTAAHSITLTLASLSVVTLPSRWVESGIALSVVVAAVNNIRPIVPFHRWVVAFVLGLLHGFGFSSVLVDLGLPDGHLLAALFGFNVGVELGQLSIVAVFIPLAFALRASWFYRRVVLLGGSAAIAILALVWSVERAFVLTIL